MKTGRAPVPRVVDLPHDDVPTLRPETPIDELRRIFAGRELPVAVIDAHGRPMGLVRKGDVVPSSEPRGGHFDRGTAPLYDEPRSVATAADVMVPAVLCVDASAPVTTAAALMAREAVSYLVVVGDQDKVVGLVTARTLLGWLGRRAGYPLPDG